MKIENLPISPKDLPIGAVWNNNGRITIISRLSGYYWVQDRGEKFIGKYDSEWGKSGGWWFEGNDEPFYGEIKVISERLEPPSK